jgi:hypothetical protein
VALFGVSVLGWLLYSSSRTELERHMSQIGFEGGLGAQMARFSIIELGWFVLFLGLSIGALVLLFSGYLSGKRASWAGVILGIVLLTDLVRANAPWLIYYDYHDRYASNGVIDVLREQPSEHRVASRLSPLSPNYLASGQGKTILGGVSEDWLQYHYQYYGIQSLDIIQMPRMPEMDATYIGNFVPRDPSRLFSAGRLWQLTNTRYTLGMTAFADALNQQFDPTNHSFRVRERFDFAPRPSANSSGGTRVEDITAVPRPEGQFAIFEYGNALPRAMLFSQWVTSTNDATTLDRLVDPNFDPHKLVVVAGGLPPSTPAAAQASNNSVRITSHEAKHVELQADAKAPSVLLLNDKWDPNWKVTVDGKPERLLRCNYIMRGVYLSPGTHRVVFDFEPPYWTLYVSLAALAVGLGLCGWLAWGPKVQAPAEAKSVATPEPATSPKSKIQNLKSKI